MVDIYNIPLYYIGFKQNKDLENQFKQIGFKNVNFFKAIDGRKYNPKDLLDKKIIDIRAYNDLVYGRQQHTGISSLGTIGCTLSHNKLWELCAKKYPYIIITEDDVIPHKLTINDVNNIKSSLGKSNGAFVSATVRKGSETLMGLHMYFLTNGAAKALYKNALPVNLQTDSYVGHLSNIGNINVEGYSIFNTKNHTSSTGDMCIKCILPSGLFFYIIIIVGIILLIFLSIFFYKKFINTNEILESCRSSCGSSCGSI